jgi:diadenosine tetraphosphate (Ap4A) HIT family hydrolase
VAGRSVSLTGAAALRLGAFALHEKLETPPVPGWLVLAPLRHVEQWDGLSAREQAELGPLVARVSAALRAETPTAKVYVSVFAEVLPHFHVHVVARPPELPAEERGAQLFLVEGRAPQAERRDLFRRVCLRLEEASARTRARSPWTPVLLSGLLWPGLGQMRNGDALKGLALATAGLVAMGAFVVRISRDAAAALLEAPPPEGFRDILTLAQEVRTRHASELSLLTFVLVAVWVVSVADAWWGARRPPVD